MFIPAATVTARCSGDGAGWCAAGDAAGGVAVGDAVGDAAGVLTVTIVWGWAMLSMALWWGMDLGEVGRGEVGRDVR